MKAYIILVGLSSLLFLAETVNVTELIGFASAVRSHYKLENAVIFLGNNYELEEIVNEFLIGVSKNGIPVLVLTKFANGSKIIKNRFTKHSISYVFLDGQKGLKDEEVLNVTASSLKCMHESKMVYVILNTIVNTEDYLRELFMWSSSKGILHAIAIFKAFQSGYLTQIYSFTIFPSFALENKTSYGLNPDILRYKMGDLKGFRLRTVIDLDTPRVIKTYVQKGGILLGGYNGNALVSFAHKHNIRLRLVYKENENNSNIHQVDVVDTIKMLNDRTIDLSIHVVPHDMLSDCALTYPCAQIDWCVMVPAAQKLPNYMYLVLPFHESVWYAFLFGLFYITIIFVIADFCLTGVPRFGRALTRTLEALLYLPLSESHLKWTWRQMIIYGPVVLFAFILCNLYMTFLTTYLTSPAYEKQIDTMSEIISKGQPIMMARHEIPILFSIDGLPEEFKKLIIGADVSNFIQHRDNLNTSYGYLVPSDKADYLLLKQKFLSDPLFRVTKTCFGNRPMSFPLPVNSPFHGILNFFIIQMHQSGLYSKWNGDSYREAEELGLVDKIKPIHEEVSPLKLTHLRLMFKIWFFGIVMSFICFLLERLRYKMALMKAAKIKRRVKVNASNYNKK